MPLQIFEWHAWDRYLITHVVPDADRVAVTPGQPLDRAAQVESAGMIHVNLSRYASVFPDYARWLARYEAAGRPVVNGYCTSIDKWAVQDACARAGLPVVRADRDGDRDEMLVIKARANHIGAYETLLPRDVVGDMAPPEWDYPERVHRLPRKDVTDAMWCDPRMTVERYIGNVEGRFQRAYVVGDFVAVATSQSAKLVKEMDHRGGVQLDSTTTASHRPPDDRDSLSIAYRLARAMRVDFAALDLALDDDGVAYPIDLNTTPIWGKDRNLNPRLIDELTAAFAPLIDHGSSYGATPGAAAPERSDAAAG